MTMILVRMTLSVLEVLMRALHFVQWQKQYGAITGDLLAEMLDQAPNHILWAREAVPLHE